ncbi:MAG: hypothetical protein NZ455_16540 [Bacteroidia bacterium]|nr:hypothetical protein [Bacteroidia bacterium]MDW8348438.1 hypothetical protein [Bacteroidia bacterium]
MRRACVSTVRSAAKHRSDSAARSTPTRAQRGTRPKIKLFFKLNNPNKSKPIQGCAKCSMVSTHFFRIWVIEHV